MTAARDRDHASSSQQLMQPQHPQAAHHSSSCQHVQQQLHGQQLAQKLQQKLQGHDNSDQPNSAATALSTSDTSPAMPDHHLDSHHHKASHAHFADDDVSAADSGVTGRNKSITAVRAAGGEGISHAEGTFWKELDADGSHRTAAGFCYICMSYIPDACIDLCRSLLNLVSAIHSCMDQSQASAVQEITLR